jgi:hypothetical protein
MTDTPTVEPYGSTTPVLALPYPAPTDPADVPADMQKLANRIEAIYGQPSGLAGLDASGKVPAGQLPAASPAGLTMIADSGFLAAAQSSIDFTAIPQTYTHLMILATLRCTGSGPTALYLALNGDTAAANYSAYRGVVAGLGVCAAQYGVAGSNAPAGQFGSNHLALFSYRSTRSKVLDCLCTRYEYVGEMTSGFWNGTVAVNRVTLTTTGTTFDIGSRAILYGIV